MLLLLGLATRWISIPLIITMLVAIFAVHWDNGWAAIADAAAEDVALRLGAARDILIEHGNYIWLTEKGLFVILNNGIEFAVTYLIMLLSLVFTVVGASPVWITSFPGCGPKIPEAVAIRHSPFPPPIVTGKW
ncbi:MAG: DoxX family protein [Halioglobus sp.]